MSVNKSLMHYDVGVVGLGYVGLTLATTLADTGLKVLGVERRTDVVEMTNAGQPHFHEEGLDYMLKAVTRDGLLKAVEGFSDDVTCSVYIITVGTPLGPDGQARLDFIQKAAGEVAANMRDGSLVILRSTVKIGTTRNVVGEVLDKSGMSYLLAMCPERTLEGKAMEELRRLPQIVGAADGKSREAAARFFHRLTPTVIQMDSYEAAEIVKLVDNTYRDVQFAFANEVARICEPFGVNAVEVIDSGKLGYPRTNLALPGLVGGPCLEKDPHLLQQSVAPYGLDLEITRAARLVNERQPYETIDTAKALYRAKYGRDPRRVAMFGAAFKGVPETNDLRGTMALPVYKSVRGALPGASVVIFDPVAVESEVRAMFAGAEVAANAEAALKDADLLLITNNNPAFAKMRVKEIIGKMAPQALIYDYWNHFARLKKQEREGMYYSVGGIDAVRTPALVR